MSRRLWLAYLIAPWGAVTPFLLLWLGMEIYARTTGPGWHYDLFITTPGHFAALVLIGYVVGAALLPLYSVFDRRGWRGWKYYVPTAIVAALATQIVITIGQIIWIVVLSPNAPPIGAMSVGVIDIAVGAVFFGVACGGLFPLVLGWCPR